MLSKKQVNDYLYFGYLFPPKIPEWLIRFEAQRNKEYSYTVENTSLLLDKVVDECLENFISNGYCIVPISGGWDSRLLAGAAVERLQTSEIKTFSFGAPGQLDYEIGRKISKHLGVEHTAIDLREIEVQWHELEQMVKQAPWTKPLDAFFNRYCIKKIAAAGDFVLSGFMGDPLTGSHMVNTSDEKEIIRLFVKRQNITNNPDLLAEDYNPIESVPPLPKSAPLDVGEMLDFGIRQANMVAPIVTPLKEWKGWGSFLGTFPQSEISIIAPFSHPSWASYWISAPQECKNDRKLFFEMFRYKYPELYKMPAKDFFGASKEIGLSRNVRRNLIRAQNRLHIHIPKFFSQSNKMHNYQDFDEAFRTREDYREILNRAFSFLKENSIAEWIDFDKILDEHMGLKADYAKSIQVLIGLALNMKMENSTRN